MWHTLVRLVRLNFARRLIRDKVDDLRHSLNHRRLLVRDRVCRVCRVWEVWEFWDSRYLLVDHRRLLGWNRV
jgi:hypothetical protein